MRKGVFLRADALSHLWIFRQDAIKALKRAEAPAEWLGDVATVDLVISVAAFGLADLASPKASALTSHERRVMHLENERFAALSARDSSALFAAVSAVRRRMAQVAENPSGSVAVAAALAQRPGLLALKVEAIAEAVAPLIGVRVVGMDAVKKAVALVRASGAVVSPALDAGPTFEPGKWYRFDEGKPIQTVKPSPVPDSSETRHP